MSRKFERVRGVGGMGVLLPVRSTEFSAGYDFFAMEDTFIPSVWKRAGRKSHTTKGSTKVAFVKDVKENHKGILVRTGVKVKMPDNFFLALYNRSSSFNKTGLMMANNTAVIDSDYYGNPDNDGEIFFNFINLSFEDYLIKKGDRIGQGIFQPYFLTEDDEAEGARTGGIGSTGR